MCKILVCVIFQIASNISKDFILYENNNKILHINISKSLYQRLQFLLQKFVDRTTFCSYKLNSYDSYIANKIIKKTQCILL